MTNAERGITRVRDEYCDPLHIELDQIDNIPVDGDPIRAINIVPGNLTSRPGLEITNTNGREIHTPRTPTGRNHIALIIYEGTGIVGVTGVFPDQAEDLPGRVPLKLFWQKAPIEVQKARTGIVKKGRNKGRKTVIEID